eukprot:2524466-Pyramimonas_sp.AAC.1
MAADCCVALYCPAHCPILSRTGLASGGVGEASKDLDPYCTALYCTVPQGPRCLARVEVSEESE